MTTFEVWAPRAERVEVLLDDTRERLLCTSSRRRGWWRADAPTVKAGQRYWFCLDGGDPMPDPRSCLQPEGVHGPSEVVDHSSFPWSDENWKGFFLPSAVLYEIHVGTFTPEGTFDAIIPKLDHLTSLGIDAIELMPIAEFPGERGWGYDGVDLFAPHHAYGGVVGLKQLVDECHRRGVGVILDVVYNHLGPDGNYLGAYGPYFTDTHKTPWGDAINFDGAGSDEVRAFFVDNAVQWCRDYHLDGLRLDAVHAIVDTSPVPFVAQISEAIDSLGVQLGCKLWTIAENNRNDPRTIVSRLESGYGIDAQWNDDVHHGFHVALTGERDGYYVDYQGVPDIAKALNDIFVYDGRYSAFRDRHHGAPVSRDTPAWHFVAFLQNHDQIGNRAFGERLSQLVDERLIAVGAAFVLLSPFTPMLFAGEEWGARTPFLYFTHHLEEALGKAVSEGRQKEFALGGKEISRVPDPQALSTFLDSKLDWSELETEQGSRMHAWYRSLIALRRSSPEFRSEGLSARGTRPGGSDRSLGHRQSESGGPKAYLSRLSGRGNLETIVAGDGEVLMMRRGRSWVIGNFGNEIYVDKNLGAADVDTHGVGVELLLGMDPEIEVDGEMLTLPPRSVCVLREALGR